MKSELEGQYPSELMIEANKNKGKLPLGHLEGLKG
jgi:hypothetical protein